jgi:type VI secretion system VasD/TssJ family lipoprotein
LFSRARNRGMLISLCGFSDGLARIKDGLFSRLLAGCVLVVLSIVMLSCSSGKQTQGSQAGQPTSPPVQPAKRADQAAIAKQDEQLANLGLTVARPLAPKAISLQYKADNTLNFYEERSHTLLLVIYQLNAVNAFNDLAKGIEGLAKLLQAERFDASVMDVSRIFVEPGETKQMDLDRAENARWVAVVAGYYDLVPGQVTRVYEIPVIIEKTGTYGFRKTEARMSRLALSFYLGPSSLQEVSF